MSLSLLMACSGCGAIGQGWGHHIADAQGWGWWLLSSLMAEGGEGCGWGQPHHCCHCWQLGVVGTSSDLLLN